MADPPATRGANATSGRDPSTGGPPGLPRWVKVSGIIVAVLVVVFVVLELLGVGGDHGPGRHVSSAGTVEQSFWFVAAATQLGRSAW